MATILVAEDDEDVRDMVAASLGACGHQVLTTRGGKEALAILSSTMTVDLLLTDMLMPDLDGLKLAEAAVALRPGLAIRFMSGFVASLHGLEAMAGKLIPKPFRIDELRAEVDKALRGAKGRTTPEAAERPVRHAGARRSAAGLNLATAARELCPEVHVVLTTGGTGHASGSNLTLGTRG